VRSNYALERAVINGPAEAKAASAGRSTRTLVSVQGRVLPPEIQFVKALTVLAIVALAAHPSASQAAQLRATSTIAGISIGASKDGTKAVLGSPTEIRKTGDAMDLEWHFGSTVVVAFWGDNGRVGEIRATGPKSCTDTGVCPGMGLHEVQRLLGQPIGDAQLGEGSNPYPTTFDTCWLDVAIHGCRVASIAIRCQP
jgi:hypothetical protein